MQSRFLRTTRGTKTRSPLLRVAEAAAAKDCSALHLTRFLCFGVEQDLSYQNSWSWFLKPRAQAKEKKLLENFHAAGFPLPKGFK